MGRGIRSGHVRCRSGPHRPATPAAGIGALWGTELAFKLMEEEKYGGRPRGRRPCCRRPKAQVDFRAGGSLCGDEVDRGREEGL